MHCRDCAGLALASVVFAPLVLASATLVLASTPLLLPVVAVGVCRSSWRFWKLRVGDVIGNDGDTTFVVLHPPNRTAEFRCISIAPDSSHGALNVWKTAEDAREFFFKVLPTSFTTVMFVPMRPKGREPISKIAEWLAQPLDVNIHVRMGRYKWTSGRANPEAAQQLTRISEFELLRPVRLIQRAWRAYSSRRRQDAARIITRAALRFLYRPGGWGYANAECSWCAQGRSDGVAVP